VSVLQTPEVKARLAKNYIGVGIDFGELKDKDPRHDVVKRYNPKQWRPVLVFLDAQGKEVHRQLRGLKGSKQALQLDEFISKRHYLTTDFQAFVYDQDD
jgi:hypothetical protein